MYVFTVNTLYCGNVEGKLKVLLGYKSGRNVTVRSLNRACVLLFSKVKLFHVRFVANNISLH